MTAPHAAFFFLLLVFSAFAVYFAVNLKREVVPDEEVHFVLSRHFASSWGIPADTPETYQAGAIGYRPVLYYWLTGRALNILEWVQPEPGNWRRLVALRLLNAFFATLSVIYCYLLSREVLPGRWWAVLVVFMLTSTLMFVFLAGGANYDNLVNLLSFAGIYYFTRVLNGKPFLANSLAGWISILTGTLVKFTVLPLAGILTIVWLIYTARNWKRVMERPVFNSGLIALSAVTLVLTGANLALYGGNLLRFGRLSPACNQVLSDEQCSQNNIVNRDARLALPEKLTLRDVMNSSSYPDPIEWLAGYWFPAMVTRIYGIHGHLRYFPNFIITLYQVLFLWLLLAGARLWRSPGTAVTGLALVIVFYAMTLIQTNFNNELATGFKHLGIQGRYIFPVIGALYILMAYVTAAIPIPPVRAASVLAMVLLYVLGGPAVTFLNPIDNILPIPDVPSEQRATQLTDGVEISQDFLSSCSGTITGIEIELSTTKQIAPYAVNMRLSALPEDQVIAEHTVQDTRIQSRVWLDMPVQDIANTRGSAFRLVVTSATAEGQSPLAVWGSKVDVLSDSQASVNGKGVNFDFRFRYHCRQPALTDWFIQSPVEP